MTSERTFIALKPDCIQRGLIGDVIKRFERRGFKLIAMKMIQASTEILEKHYIEHKGRLFLPALIEFMSSSPIIVMVWEGVDIISVARHMIGATNPKEATNGSIRGDFCINVGRNIIHGSDGPKSAEREIKLWFDETEMSDWIKCDNAWIYE